MALLEDQLFTKKSTLPNSGTGLFTKKIILKGSRITEYKGRKKKWKEVTDPENPYIFFINNQHVIDALNHKKMLARYANDARGLTKIIGLKNNTAFVTDNNRVFIEAIRTINPGEEIFVGYGKDYWDTIKMNKTIDAKNGTH